MHRQLVVAEHRCRHAERLVALRGQCLVADALGQCDRLARLIARAGVVAQVAVDGRRGAERLRPHRVTFGEGDQARRYAAVVAVELEVDAGLGELTQRGEGGLGVAERLLDARRLLQERRFLLAPHRGARRARRGVQALQRRGFAAGGQPMPGDARRLVRPRLQPFGDGDVHMRGDRRRDARQRGFVDEVVRELAAAQDLRCLQLAPGVGEREGSHVEHVLGQRDLEVGARDGGNAGQHERRLRELLKAPADQRADRRRPGQLARREAAGEKRELERLERIHRVAAGVLHETRGDAFGLHALDRQRGEQLGHLFDAERCQRHRLDGLRLEQLVAHRLQGRRAFGGAHREAPRRPARLLGRGQRGQQLQARRVGEVQIVDDDAAQVPGWRRGEPRRGRVRHALRVDDGRRVGQLRLYGSEQAQHRRVRHVLVARSRPADDDECLWMRLRRREFLEQARLAHAGVSGDHEGAALGPGPAQRAQRRRPADDHRRPKHRRRNRSCARPHGGSGGSAPRFAQGQRLRARRAAELRAQQRLAVPIGGERRRVVAAQVVQADDALMRMLLERRDREPAQRQRQRGVDVAGAFEAIGLGIDGFRAAAPLAFAGFGQPAVEGRAVAVIVAAQQLGARIVGGRGCGGGVVANVVGQGQRAFAESQLAARLLVQAEQALAQIGRGRGFADVGPEQGGNGPTRRLAAQRQVGKQAGRLGLQRVTRARDGHARHAAQVQFDEARIGDGRSGHGCRGRRGRGAGCGNTPVLRKAA